MKQSIYKDGPGVLLAALIDSKIVYLEKTGYMAIASDGMIVQIASIYDNLKDVEDYLQEHPSPDRW